LGDSGLPSGPTGAEGGTPAGDPFAADVKPVQAGTLWRFTLGNDVFEVDPPNGASVATFSRNGRNVLAAGSWFRPSPQIRWNWPPPPEIETATYTASASGDVLSAQSPESTTWHLKASRRFWANAENEVVTIEYTLINTAPAAASWAPWEDSRVNATGLTFFPAGQTIANKSPPQQVLPLQSSGGVWYLDYQNSQLSNGKYIVASDGSEGWFAHAESGIVFIKTFPDYPAAQIPPNEGKIQLYTEDTHLFLEMEEEGAYGSIAAGGSIVWTVHWYLRDIPSGAAATVGSAALVDFVRGQILK
jgi:hypothetical protein